MDAKNLYTALKCCERGNCDDCPKNTIFQITRNRCRNGLLKDCREFMEEFLEDSDGDANETYN
jgi:hypothetical protein